LKICRKKREIYIRIKATKKINNPESKNNGSPKKYKREKKDGRKSLVKKDKSMEKK
jgi:hypothetical protein